MSESTPPGEEGDPIAVEVLTWVLYLGWLAAMGAGALWLGVPPLPTIAEAFVVPWQGQVAAVVGAVVFLLVSQQLFAALRATGKGSD